MSDADVAPVRKAPQGSEGLYRHLAEVQAILLDAHGRGLRAIGPDDAAMRITSFTSTESGRRVRLTTTAVPVGNEDLGVPPSLQQRIRAAVVECFGRVIADDREERQDRFCEEALETLQALGYPEERVQKLLRYVYDRPVGEVSQEVGGTMLTLAALCSAFGLDMVECAEVELRRFRANMPKIRAKQAAKPKHSALPV